MSKLMHRWVFISLLAVLVLLGAGSTGPAQAKYPTRPVTVIVPYITGGTLDIMDRVLAAYLAEKWGVPVQIVNKPGGNTIPATLEVMQSAPDGYTLVADSQGSCSMLIVIKDLPFKVLNRSFVAIAAATPMMYTVPASSPWKTMKDLAEGIKKDPEGLVWASGGSTSTPSVAIRQLLSSLNVDIAKTKEIVSKGGAESMAFIAGGHVKLGSPTPVSAMAALKAGTVRPLAVTSRERFPLLPDVPTTRESGFPNLDIQLWGGFSGPPNLPGEVIETWNQTLKSALADPKVVGQLRNIGAVPYYLNSAEFRNLTVKEMEEAKKLFNLK